MEQSDSESGDASRRLQQLPNFRPALPQSKKRQQLLYRSSYIERLSKQGLAELASTVQSVIDLRGSRGLVEEATRRLVGSEFQMKRLLLPTGELQLTGESTAAADAAVHYSVDFVGRQFYRAAVTRMPWLRLMQFGCYGLAYKVTADTKWFASMVGIIYSTEAQLSDLYVDMLDFCHEELLAVLKLLIDSNNLPCLLHCHLGKDRTGIVVMLLQWLLGYDRQAIASEYYLSEEQTRSVSEEVYKFYAGSNLPQKFARCEEADILAAMDHIQAKYGTVEQYLLVVGLTQEDIEALRRIYGDSDGSD